MNKQTVKLSGVTDTDYRRWCRENKRPIHNKSSKEEFFKRILDGRLAKSRETGKLVRKHRTKE